MNQTEPITMTDNYKKLFRECVKEALERRVGRPKTRNLNPNPHAPQASKIIQSIVGDDVKNVTGWNTKEDGNIVTFRINMKLINQLSLENILEFTERGHGQVRLYPEEYSVVLEIKVKKQ